MKHAAIRFVSSFVAASLLAAAAPAGQTATCCTADLDGSGGIDGADLATLLGLWGPCGACAADLNGDGEVGGADLAIMLGQWGECQTFEYPDPPANAEAAQIALEMLGPGGPLLYAPADYDRIDRDLALIRAAHPGLVGQTHSQAWAPNALIVKVLHNVSLDEYECYNAFYQVVSEQFLFTSGGGDWYVIRFAGNLNVERLGLIYAALDEIQFADPDFLIGGQNFYEPTDMGGGVWRWDIDDGFHDCFDGCDCHRLYTIETDAAGNVNLLNYQEIGQPWCDFGVTK